MRLSVPSWRLSTRWLRTVDTRVAVPDGDMPAAVPVLVWNTHPWPVDEIVEIEVPLDYRPIHAYLDRPQELPIEVLGPDGEPLPFQRTATEHSFCLMLAWRVRLVVPLRLPPMGWQVVRVAWNETLRLAAPAPMGAAVQRRTGPASRAANTGSRRAWGKAGCICFRAGEPLFGTDGMTFATMDDPWGAWGGHDNEPGSNSISNVREVWRVARLETLESGPERATLWVRLEAGGSQLELTLRLARHAPGVEIIGRLVWNERAARLKLRLPNEGLAEYEVPGGAIRRGDLGEVPGGRWVRGARFAFLSDAIYNFDAKDGVLHATLVRSCRYAASHATTPDEFPARPYMDLGEHRFHALITAPDADSVTACR